LRIALSVERPTDFVPAFATRLEIAVSAGPLLRELRKIDPEAEEVWQATVFDGLEIEDIADRRHCSRNTVRRARRRARNFMLQRSKANGQI